MASQFSLINHGDSLIPSEEEESKEDVSAIDLHLVESKAPTEGFVAKDLTPFVSHPAGPFALLFSQQYHK